MWSFTGFLENSYSGDDSSQKTGVPKGDVIQKESCQSCVCAILYSTGTCTPPDDARRCELDCHFEVHSDFEEQ